MADGNPSRIVFVDPLVEEGELEGAFYFGLAGVAEGGADMVFYRRQMGMERFANVSKELASKQIVAIPGLSSSDYHSELIAAYLDHPSDRYVHVNGKGKRSVLNAVPEGEDLKVEPVSFGTISEDGLEAQTAGSKDALGEIKKYIDETVGA